MFFHQNQVCGMAHISLQVPVVTTTKEQTNTFYQNFRREHGTHRYGTWQKVRLRTLKSQNQYDYLYQTDTRDQQRSAFGLAKADRSIECGK